MALSTLIHPGSGSGMNNPDHISESLKTIFWAKILKFFDVDPGFGIRDNQDPGSGMEKSRIRYLKFHTRI
jgi:hypothetical protein